MFPTFVVAFVISHVPSAVAVAVVVYPCPWLPHLSSTTADAIDN